MRALTVVTALALSAAAALPAQATVLIQFSEVGPDVVATLDGSLDLSGMRLYTQLNANYGVRPPSATAVFGGYLDLYTGFSGPSSWGNGGTLLAGSHSGGSFAIVGAPMPFQPELIGVSRDYVFGTPLSGIMTFANQTIADMGLTRGRYVYTLPSDQVVVQVGMVPEPATWAMMIAGFGLTGVMLRRRQDEAIPA